MLVQTKLYSASQWVAEFHVTDPNFLVQLH